MAHSYSQDVEATAGSVLQSMCFFILPQSTRRLRLWYGSSLLGISNPLHRGCLHLDGAVCLLPVNEPRSVETTSSYATLCAQSPVLRQ